MTCTITVKRGSLYVAHDTYETYFSGINGVILQRRAGDLVVLPVRHVASGGYVVKHRNALGDRVVAAPDFFRSQGVDEGFALDIAVEWNAALGGLLARDLFCAEMKK